MVRVVRTKVTIEGRVHEETVILEGEEPPAWEADCDQFLYAVVTKSTRPVIVTFGAGACAKLGGASNPRMARTARTTTTDLLITASSCGR